MQQHSDTRVQSLTLLIILSLIWGTSFILMKKGLVVFSPPELGALRVATAALFLAPIALTKLRGLGMNHLGKLLTSGLLGIFFPAFLFAFAQTRLSSSVAGILNTLTPIFTLVIGVIAFGQLFRRQAIVGIAAGLAGSFLLVTANTNGSVSGVNAYAFLVILACVFYATNLNFIKYRIADLDAITITSVSLLLIGPVAILYLVGFTPFIPTMQNAPGAWEAFGYVALLGFMGTSLATVLFNKLVKISTPLYTSSVTYLIPVVAVFWGVVDGERLLPGHLIGMVAIVSGVYLANRKP